MPTASRLLTAATFGGVALVLSTVFCTIWLIALLQGDLFLIAVLFTAMLAFVVSDLFWLAARTRSGALLATCFGAALAFGVFALSTFIFYTAASILSFETFVVFEAGGWLVLPGGALAGLVAWVWLWRDKGSPDNL